MKLSGVSKQKSTATVTILDPSTDIPLEVNGVEMKITVHGKYSDEFRKAMHKVQNDRMKMKNKTVTAERSERENESLLASVTVEWQGFFDENDNPIECNQENAESMYHEYPWIKQQVDEFIGDDAHFFS